MAAPDSGVAIRLSSTCPVGTPVWTAAFASAAGSSLEELPGAHAPSARSTAAALSALFTDGMDFIGVSQGRSGFEGNLRSL